MCKIGKLSFVAGAEMPEALPPRIRRCHRLAQPDRRLAPPEGRRAAARGPRAVSRRPPPAGRRAPRRGPKPARARSHPRDRRGRQARALPGVSVFTAADLPEVARRASPPRSAGRPTRGPTSRPCSRREWCATSASRWPSSSRTTPIAWRDALDGVAVDYDAAAARDDARGRRPGRRSGPRGLARQRRRRRPRRRPGDVERAFASADLVVEERLRHPRITAVPIEPRGVLAYRGSGVRPLVVWSSTQNPYLVRDAVAVALGLPAEEVRVLAPDVGGGFGPKGSVYHEEILVAGRRPPPRTAREVGRGAARALRRHGPRPRAGPRGRGSASGGTGRSSPSTTRSWPTWAPIPSRATGLTLNTVNHLPGPYRVPHYRNVGTSYVTNKTHNAAYRGAGRPEAVFVMERLLDIGARRLGLDPVESAGAISCGPARCRTGPGLTYKDGVPDRLRPGRLPRRRSSARSSSLRYAGAPRPPGGPGAGRPRRIGRRRRLLRQGSGLGPYEGAAGARRPERHRSTSPSASPRRARATRRPSPRSAPPSSACALDDVVIVAGDTQLFPIGMGTGGSRVAANTGPAVARTAREVRGARPAGRRRAPRVRARGRAHRGRAALRGRRPGARASRSAGSPTPPSGRRPSARPASPASSAARYFYPDTVTWAFGTQAAAVEVDSRPATIRLLAYAVVARQRARDQSRHRRGSAPGRRGAGHRRRALGGARLRRLGAARDREPDGLRAPEGRPAAAAPGGPASTTPRS